MISYYSGKFFWKIIYVIWLPFLRLIEMLKIHNSRQKYLLGHLSTNFNKGNLTKLLLEQGFEFDIIALKDPGQILGMRKLNTPLYQYHIRLFIDGEIRGHYEYSPEARPIAHSFETGIEPRKDFFENLLGEYIEKEIKFTALFVQDVEGLLRRFPPKHKKVFGQHSTIEYMPESLAGIEVGKELQIKIVGRAFDEFGDDLLVENPKSKNKYPHITLSRGEDAPPLYSNILFDKAIKSNAIEYFTDEKVKVIEGYSDGDNNIIQK